MDDTFPHEVLAEVRLSSVRGVGPLLRKRLVESLGSAGRVLDASERELAGTPGVGDKIAASIRSAPSSEAAVLMLRDAASHGVRVLTLADEEYPPRLRQIHDAPPVLYCRGAIEPCDERAVAIVGTRRASRYGLRQAERLAKGLAEAGVTVVSGLARGVDGVAHQAALDAGGRTLAALAGGLNRIYPPEHAALADRVAERGALLAEAPPPMPPMSGAFPQRNRVISALSLGVVVIEAAERSGALITARHAAEQGRDAFAVPGPIDSPQSAGCHRLIQEGAKLVTCVEDILEELESCETTAALTSPQRTELEPESRVEVARSTATRDWGEPEKTVLESIGQDATPIDRVVQQTGLPVEQVLAGISQLELAGEVLRVSGFAVSRAS